MCPKDEDIARLPVKNILKEYDVNDPYVKEVLDFVRRFQIQPGDTPIEAMRIYLKYKHSKGSKAINFKRFLMKFSKFFKRKRRKHGYVYFLNNNAFDLTQDGFWEYRRRLRNEKENRRKEKEEKKD